MAHNTIISYFENKLVLLLFDIYYNIPQKDHLIGFAKSLFPEDDLDIIKNSPIANTFDLLNEAYWLSFFYRIRYTNVSHSELKRNREGEILGTEETAKIWADWQAKKDRLYNLYFEFDDNFRKIKRPF